VSASSVRKEVVLPPVAPLKEAAATTVGCRALDLLVSTVLLILLAPLFIAIAVAIRVESGGPVLFRQRRFGIGLSTFTIYKFRTMTAGTSAEPHREYIQGLIRGEAGAPVDGGLFKLESDTRITRVGQVLRRFSLDELPQLWNVFTGTMSIVGPRPAIPYEVEHYKPHWYRRFGVKPGMTGLWQVSGRNRLNFGDMVQLDLDYAQRRSLWLNLRILAKTPWVVATGKGAA
jgi:lipopolysaccharide/colanic/teichoic acid biosynthesis glycosyltransferase